jgi:hypothetical protein
MTICLACGRKLPTLLARCGSLRCAACRDTNAPLRPELVAKAA